MPELEQVPVETEVAANGQAAASLTRFTRAQRYLHAVLFTTFLGLAGTGLAVALQREHLGARSGQARGRLRRDSLLPQVLRDGADDRVSHSRERDLHARLVSTARRESSGAPTSMVANWKDAKDLFGHMRWLMGLGPKPKFDRYAYWEKFDYWAVFWGMIVIGFSGYAMWFAPFFAHFLPGWALNAVLVIHSEEGLLAILFIFSIHFVNTHLRPDSFPMDMVIFTGVESEEEFKHKRPLEYARMVREGKLEQRLGTAPAQWFVNGARIVGFTAIFIGLTLLVLTLTAYFR